MPSYCADTSFLIDVLRGQASATTRVEAFKVRGDPVAIPAPVVTELLLGGLARGGRQLADVLRLIEGLGVLATGLEAAREAAHIGWELRQHGRVLDLADLLIAGTARSHRLVLVTRDSDFEGISGLAVEGY
jgi:tRNA(fMet)-specific endonuclease VapC